MDPIHHILVIVDPTRAEQPAVAKAALLAKHFHAELQLFACDTKASLATRQTAHARKFPNEAFSKDLQPMLEALALPLRARGLSVTTHAMQQIEPLYRALLQHLKHTMADLIVKDTHHHSIARRTFLSNTDWQLIRGCAKPLLLVKAREWSREPCIVAAVDPSHANDKPSTLDHRILDYASLLAKHLAGQLHAAHAYLPAPTTTHNVAGETPVIGIITAASLLQEDRREHAHIDSLLTSFSIAAGHVHVKLGSPIEVLTDLAESLPADITVMGAIARSGLDRTFVGSTAEDILERLSCDALVIKTPDFGESLPF